MAKDEKKSSLNQKKKTEEENGSKNTILKIIKIAVFVLAIVPLFTILIDIKKEKNNNILIRQSIIKAYNEKYPDIPVENVKPTENVKPVEKEKRDEKETPISQDNNKTQEKKEEEIKNKNVYRKFRQSEMEKYFTVELIHSNEPENYFMKRALKDYDINEDEKMKEYPKEYEANSILYGKYIEKDYTKDNRFYIQLIDQHKGYGLFANEKIKQNDVIGVYTGLISMELGKKIFDTRYLFHITSIKHPYTGAKADLYIDARVAGNQLRFVNHDSEPNCKAVYVPHKGMWNVVFIADRDIDAHEEITIKYGKSFRSVRGKEIENKVEESGPDDYMDTEWDIKRKEEKEARDPNTGKKLHHNIPNRYELEDQKRKILERMRKSGGYN